MQKMFRGCIVLIVIILAGPYLMDILLTELNTSIRSFFNNWRPAPQQEELSVSQIRSLMQRYVPTYNRRYSKEDFRIDNNFITFMTNMHNRNFNWEYMLKMAEVQNIVGEIAGGNRNNQQRLSNILMSELGYQSIIYEPINNMQYVIAFKNTTSGVSNVEVLISFHGTDLTPADITANTNNSLVNGVHKGYWEMAEKLISNRHRINFHVDDIFNKTLTFSLDDLINDSNTKFTLIGHSMGGAIAQAFAIWLMNLGVDSERITGYTFNSALVITERQKHYNLDFSWFNIMNRTDNVSAGAVFRSLGRNGRRLGFDIPINDPNMPNAHYEGNITPNKEHHPMYYLLNILNHENTRRMFFHQFE